MEKIFIIVLSFLVFIIYRVWSFSRRKVSVDTAASPYTKNIQERLLSINGMMADNADIFGDDVECWYSLNEAMLEYITVYLNRISSDDKGAYSSAFEFLDEFEAFINSMIRSSNRVELIRDLTKKLAGNEPVFGIRQE